MLRRVHRGLMLLLFVPVACAGAKSPDSPPPEGPMLSFPVSIAEGEGDGDGDEARSPDAGRRAVAEAVPEKPPPQSAPDPEPLRLARQWEYEVVYDHGKLSVAGVRVMRFDKPIVTARRMGRYALELWIGHELVDRVRFDFPLLAAEEPAHPRRPLHEPPSLAAGTRASQRVLVPASPRATRAVLVDRATGETRDLPWPPDAPIASAAAEAAAADGGS
jgi:hypothetical protein